MMSNIAIKVSNLSKVYKLYDRPIDRLKESLNPFGKKYHRDFYALRDVSFEVKKGETIGIIGRNGSGKSTLLKIITGVLTPTNGSVEVNGRIASLLELGAGFNPEYTGIENIYFQGSLMGYTREEMDARIDEILSFADIGDFVKQPVKMYSSGMFVRLAFAVAINVSPDILVVDEALAVGDELFQRKCFSRIATMQANGITILFVSHSGAQIIELCDRAMLLDAGEKLAMGLPKQIVGRYQKLLYAPADKQFLVREQIRRIDVDESVVGHPIAVGVSLETNDNIPAHKTKLQEESFDPNLKPTSTIEYESHGVYIESPGILTLAGQQVNNLIQGRTYRYVYHVRFTRSASNVRFGMLIKTTSGLELGGGVSARSQLDSLLYVGAGSHYRVEFQFRCLLNPGVFFLNAGVVGDVNGTEGYLHRLIDIAMFRVLPDTDSLATGIIDFGCSSEIELLR